MIVSKRIKDLTGNVFGEMTVLGFAGYSNPKTGRPRPTWRIRCSCGVEKIMLSTTLRNTKVKSCGHMRGKNTLPDNAGAINLRYGQYKKSAKKAGREFLLSIDDFTKLISSNCVYCGACPSSVVKARGVYQIDFWYNGIDRVNNDEGYRLSNAAPCCVTCNLMKRSMTADNFIAHIRRISNYQKDCPSSAANTKSPY
jgi:hypothetical protein